MPYVSDAQRRWAHTDTGIKALGGKDKVREWDNASRGKKLPERVKKAIEQHAIAAALQVYGLAKQAVSDDWIRKHVDQGTDTVFKKYVERSTKGEPLTLGDFEDELYRRADKIKQRYDSRNARRLQSNPTSVTTPIGAPTSTPTVPTSVTTPIGAPTSTPTVPTPKIPHPGKSQLTSNLGKGRAGLGAAAGALALAGGAYGLYRHFNKPNPNQQQVSIKQAHLDALETFGISKEAVSPEWILKHLNNYAKKNTDPKNPYGSMLTQKASDRVHKAYKSFSSKALKPSQTGEHPTIHSLKNYIAHAHLTNTAKHDSLSSPPKPSIDPHLLRLFKENKPWFPTKVFDQRPDGTKLTKKFKDFPGMKFPEVNFPPIKVNTTLPKNLFKPPTPPNDALHLTLGLSALLAGVGLYDYYSQSKKPNKQNKPNKKKVAELAASNAIATYSGAKKPTPPNKPKIPSALNQTKSQPQNNSTNERGGLIDPNVEGALTQKSLGSGAEKLETGSTLPITT